MHSVRIVAIDNSDPNILTVKATRMLTDSLEENPDAQFTVFNVVPAVMHYFVNRTVGLHQVVSVSVGKATDGQWQIQTLDRRNLKDYFGYAHTFFMVGDAHSRMHLSLLHRHPTALLFYLDGVHVCAGIRPPTFTGLRRLRSPHR
jgi:hypothetical protein